MKKEKSKKKEEKVELPAEETAAEVVNPEENKVEGEEKVKKPAWKVAVGITLDVLLVCFALLAVATIVFRINSQRYGTLTIGNYEYRTVATDSMTQYNHKNYVYNDNRATSPARELHPEYSSFGIHTLPVDTLVKIDKIGGNHQGFYDNCRVGDVLTFKYYYTSGPFAGTQQVVTHRLARIDDDPNSSKGYIFYMLADKAPEPIQPTDYEIIYTAQDATSRNFVMGKVVSANAFLGSAITFLTSPTGIIVFVIAPCAGLFLYEAVKIFMILTEDRRKEKAAITKQKEEKLHSQEDEIARLRAQLAAATKASEENKEEAPKEESKEATSDNAVKEDSEPKEE